MNVVDFFSHMSRALSHPETDFEFDIYIRRCCRMTLFMGAVLSIDGIKFIEFESLL